MLNCNVIPQHINVNCETCQKCSGKSKFDYPFQKDLFNSDGFVNALMEHIERTTGAKCRKTTIDKNPDINVFSKSGALVCRVEAKYLEGQAFMKSFNTCGLYPKECLVIDRPKLLSYFDCKENDRRKGCNIPIYVAWKFDRPCEDIGGITIAQEIDVLRQIYNQYGDVRFFERAEAITDYSNGRRLGITSKYHFSIRECFPIENLVEEIRRLLYSLPTM